MDTGTVKTTLELDAAKLEKVMKLGRFATMKEAVDWALTEAVRIATLNHIKENPWPESVLKEAIAEDYDVLAARQEIRQDPVRYTLPKRRRRK